MCFRPATAAGGTIECPECGATNPDIAMKCIKCKCDLSELTKDARAALLGNAQPTSAAPRATMSSAPAAPGAPTAPKPPTAPPRTGE